MPGVKGRSGGAGKKSVARHLAEGTYRADRHGPLPSAIRTQENDPLPPAELNLDVLELTDEERKMLHHVIGAIGGVPAHMSIPLLVLVPNLTLYARLHADALAAGAMTIGRLGLMISPQMKARDMILRQLRADFAAFALSMTERAALLDLAQKVKERSNKPSPGKPLK